MKRENRLLKNLNIMNHFKYFASLYIVDKPLPSTAYKYVFFCDTRRIQLRTFTHQSSNILIRNSLYKKV